MWNVPVIFGPNNARFQEAQDLKQNGGGKEINTAEDFQQIMLQYEQNAQALQTDGATAGRYVETLTGATQKIMQKVFGNR